MGQLFIDTGGAATNSGSTDQNAANLSGSAATAAATVITLDGSPDLSGLVTSGATQSAIYLAEATNANKKIFWITAFDDGLNTVTVDTAPTGIVGSAWAIGGRQTVVDTALSVCRAGDVCTVNNSPAAVAGTVATFRIAGDSTSGPVKLVGKTGVRPVLNTTTTANCVTSAVAYSWIENLEIDQDGATGNGINCSAAGLIVFNVKISDAGAIGINCTGANPSVIACEITGVAGDGIQMGSGSSALFAMGNYIHDITGDGIEFASATVSGNMTFNIFDTCAARGVYQSSASAAQSRLRLFNNDFYACGNSGLEIVDADVSVDLVGNIFQDCGDAAGEFNVEVTAGSEANSYHAYNCFHHQGGGGGANLSGLVTNSTEITTDPLFTNPAAGDFTLQSGSPCKATGWPGQFLGGPLGYLDMGAVQRQEPAGGGGGSTGHVIGGGT